MNKLQNRNSIVKLLSYTVPVKVPTDKAKQLLNLLSKERDLKKMLDERSISENEYCAALYLIRSDKINVERATGKLVEFISQSKNGFLPRFKL